MRIVSACLVTATALGCVAPALAQRWPVEPADSDHHVMTGFEYVYDDSSHTYFIHSGLDVFADPGSASPRVVSVGNSKFCPYFDPCESLGCEFGCDASINVGCHSAHDVGYWIELKSDDGQLRTYGHLDSSTYTSDLISAFEANTVLPAGTPMANVVQWEKPCASDGVYPNHLHFMVQDCKSFALINPTTTLTTYGPTDPVQIIRWSLAKDDHGYASGEVPWEVVAAPAVPGTCTAVDGKIDMIVEYESHHRPDGLKRHGDNLGVRSTRWRACGGWDPDCAWEPAYDWKTISTVWTSANEYTKWMFSKRSPFDTSSSFLCGDDEFYAIPTNFVDDGSGLVKPDIAGAWDTGSTPSPTADKQHVTASVQVEDFSGQLATQRMTVCMGGTPFGKLLIRDCDLDDGTEPSSCDTWTTSPDIILEKAPAGSATPQQLRICMRNIGDGPIPKRDTVSIKIDTEPPGAFGPCVGLGATFSTMVVGMTTRLGGPVPFADWGPVEERCAVTDWPPAPGLLGALTCKRLLAAVFRTGDTPNAYPSLAYDNNRAETDAYTPPTIIPPILATNSVPFIRVPGPDPGPMHRVDVVFTHQDGERWYEKPAVPLSTGSPSPPPRPAEIHVAPGMRFRGLTGGTLLGVVAPDRYAKWRSAPTSAPLSIASRDDASQDVAEWRIISVPAGVDRAQLIDAVVEGPGELSVWAWGADAPTGFRVSIFAPPAPEKPPIEIRQDVRSLVADERAASR